MHSIYKYNQEWQQLKSTWLDDISIKIIKSNSAIFEVEISNDLINFLMTLVFGNYSSNPNQVEKPTLLERR